MERQKRAAAIHDISCLGKCSLTVALPIISAAGIECCAVPTAVLSTHTGGFTGYTYRDLTDDLMPIAEHWRTLDFAFDAFYTGYLGSAEQIELVAACFDMLGSGDTLKLVDPVMADNGVLYAGFAPDFPQRMKQLCAKADVICPNLTEAVFMLGGQYREGPFEKAYLEDILLSLAELGPKKVVLTGVYFDDEYLGAASYENGDIHYNFARRIEGMYHGTGDVFGSALLSGLLNGRNLSQSCQIACDFTADSVRFTRDSEQPVTYGVRFEAALPRMMRDLGLI